MLMISNSQILYLSRAVFFEKVRHFIILNSINDGFKKFVRNNKVIDSLWNTNWNKIKHNNEFDCSILIILLTVKNYLSEEHNDIYYLSQSDRYNIKKHLAQIGFFKFSSFDYPKE